MTTAPYPNLSPAAWTLLVRAEPDQAITVELAARVVGQDNAHAAVRELAEKHMLDEESQFMPVALALRRWNPP